VSLAEITATRAAGRVAPASATRASTLFGWTGGISALVLLIWLVPIKRYTLPVTLPFQLEPYRLWILVLVVALVVAALVGRARVSAAGHGKPLLLLAVAALGAQLANNGEISANGLQTQSLKSLSYFLSFLVAFLLITSTIRHRDEIDAIVRTLVIGGAIVAVAALIEGKTHHNYFNDLHRWIPVLHDTGQDKYNYRGGRLRVRASSQHPIALAGALLLTVPLAIYVSRRAISAARSRLWLGAALLLTAGALATVSRTAVLMLLAMTITALVFRPRQVLRRWPVLIVLLALTHFTAPGAIGHLYDAFNPKQGLVNQQSVRTSQQGSGRLADFGPGLHRWSQKPLFGRGLGTSATTAEPSALDASGTTGIRVIYDDQYLSTLISLGGLGFVGVIWFLWGAVRKLGRAVSRPAGHSDDLLLACTASTAAFAAGMFTYDAFSFVQVSLLFFVICGLGLRARAALVEHE
jgi:hypothetical protein